MKKQPATTTFYVPRQTPYEKLKQSNPDLAYKLLSWQDDNEIRFWKLTETGKDSLQKYTQEELDMLIKHLETI